MRRKIALLSFAIGIVATLYATRAYGHRVLEAEATSFTPGFRGQEPVLEADDFRVRATPNPIPNPGYAACLARADAADRITSLMVGADDPLAGQKTAIGMTLSHINEDPLTQQQEISAVALAAPPRTAT